MTKQKFDEMIEATGAFNGDRFASEEQVRDYCTAGMMEDLFGESPYAQEQLWDLAEEIISRREHCDF